MSRIRPLKGQCLVEIQPFDKTTKGGLHLPDDWDGTNRGEKSPMIFGLVVEIGAWRETKHGFHVIPEFRVGDRVLISHYGGQDVAHGYGDKLKLVNQTSVFAIVSDSV